MLETIAALVVALQAGGCSGGYPTGASSRHDDRTHPRIVSLNPCTDAILDAVTIPGQLVAISTFSRNPNTSSMDRARAARYRAIGDSVEEVLAMQPDVVVASSFLAPATRSALEGLGIKVVSVPIASSIAQSEAQVRALATLAGNPARGAAMVARIDAAIAQAAPPAGTRPVAALMWEKGGIVAGDNTLISQLMARSGFTNVAPAAGLTQGTYVPLERVLAHPPAVILAETDSGGERDRLLNNPLLDHLDDTVRADVPGRLLWCGGPTITRTVARLARIRRAVGRSSPTPPHALPDAERRQ